jgi:hydroxymethylpyrimidine pyrophosphatase-like HAD family hydrolase
MLGIPEREVITVGDSKNDVSMLSLEGLTLATLNAWDEAKAVADRVICKNTEHIAEWILENIINKP